jgi:hypothetical protein
MYILGISGKCGVGKNYLTENYIIPKIIEYHSNPTTIIVPYFFSFGSFVKTELYSRDSTDTLTYSNLFSEKTKETRIMLQEYATENGRDVYRKDMWIRAVDLWIQIHKRNLEIINRRLKVKLEPLFVIEDVRFENEYSYIKDYKGILVLIEAPKRHLNKLKYENNTSLNFCKHQSELGLEHLSFNCRLKNDPENITEVIFEIDNFVKSTFQKKIYKSLSFNDIDMQNADSNEISEILRHSFRH